MGHNPIPPRSGVTLDQAAYALVRATGDVQGEAFNLSRAREGYARGRLDLDELELAIEHVLRGGYLDENFLLRAPILDRVRRRRRQRDCEHSNVYTLFGMGDAKAREICADCGDVPYDDIRAAWRGH